MVRVTIDSGPVDATHKFEDTPRNKWFDLVLAKKQWLNTRIAYDCRCLIEAVEEANQVWQELGYHSAEEMIRHGYGLDPVEIDLAVAWLRHNENGEPIALDDVKAKVAEAKREALEVKQGTRTDLTSLNIKEVDGNSNGHVLRRLAREGFEELLGKIESGEMSVNAAAIQAGFRKKMVMVPVGDIYAAVRALTKHYEASDLVKVLNER